MITTFDEFLKLLPTSKMVWLKRNGLDYLNEYVVKDGRELFYRYHPDVQDELRTMFPNCIFLKAP